MDDKEVRRTQALWYAWGRQDAGEPLIADAFEFAAAYVARQELYWDGRVGWAPSMQDAFARWNAGEDMRVDVRVRLGYRVSLVKRRAVKA